jgi:hypothetical protein
MDSRVSTEFRRHGIRYILYYLRIFSMLCSALYFRPISVEIWYTKIHGIPRNFGDFKSQSLQYVRV